MLCIRLGGQTHNGSYKEECFSLGLLSSEAPLPPPSLNSHPSVLSEKSHSPRIARNCAAKWRRKWHPTPVLLPGEFLGQRSLSGYSPWDCKDLDTTEGLSLTHMVFISSGSTLRKTNKHKNADCKNCELSLFSVY